MRSILLASTIAVGVSGAAHAQDADKLAKIGHIVVIFEENRSFDNLFGLFPGANGLLNAGEAQHQVDLDGHVYQTLPPVKNTNMRPTVVDMRFPAEIPNGPFAIDPYVPLNVTTGDMIHRWYQEPMQIDGGKMDKYAAISDGGGLVMGYYDMSKSAQWRLASEFAIGDAMFHSAFGGSFLNHSFLVCSCAYRWPEAPAKIVAQVDANGRMVQATGRSRRTATRSTRAARSICTRRPTPTRACWCRRRRCRISATGWTRRAWTGRWYSGGYDDAMAGKPDPLFQFHHQPLAFFQDLAPGTNAQKAHLRDVKDLYADIEKNTLPPVVFYKPIGELNLHPGYANITDGDEHLADLVTRLQKSDAYKDMLIIVTYDEHGGLWDHVAPPKRDMWGPGTRIPLIAIGPTVKRGFIDHTTYDFGSILKTISMRFGIEPVGSADRDATPMTNLLQ